MKMKKLFTTTAVAAMLTTALTLTGCSLTDTETPITPQVGNSGSGSVLPGTESSVGSAETPEISVPLDDDTHASTDAVIGE